METYLFKFSACLAIFWLVYILFLERQTMHRFKRFYLLAAVVSALIIPVLTITHYIEPIVTDFEVLPVFIPMESSFTEIPQVKAPFWDLEMVLWMFYGLGVLLFSLRFVVNLFKMYRRIADNKTILKHSFIYVLLEECSIPHSFFKYLFFDRSKYETNTIPDEVKLHEETHAKQLHSLDIIVIELLQIVFWFHPLIYMLKHHIKLNHEFLADQAVLEQGTDTKIYQQLLLQFSSNTDEYQLSSAINYSSIKKRFTVMKTQTSKSRIWVSSFLLLPIIAILFYSFAEREYVEKVTLPSSHSTNDHFARSIDLKVLNDNSYLVDGIKATKQTFIAVFNQLHQDITLEVRNKIMNIHVSSSKEVSDKEVWFIYNSLIDYGFYRIVTPNQDINRAKGNTPFAIESRFSTQEKATVKQVAAYNTWAKQLNVSDHKIIKKKELEKYKYIYSIMTAEQKKTSEAFPKLPPPPPKPESSKTIKPIEILIKKDNNVVLNGEPIAFKDLANSVSEINKDLTIEERRNYVMASIIMERNESLDFAEKVQRELRKVEVWSFSMDYAESQKKQSLPTKHYSPNAGLTIKEAKAQQEQALKNYNASQQNQKGDKKSSWAIETGVATVVEDTQQKSGPIEINGAIYYFSQLNGKTTYFDRYGKVVDINKIPPPPPIPNDATPEQKEKMKKATQAYMKANPDKVGKAKGENGEVFDVIEIPDDLQGSVDINGETLYYTTSNGKTTYFNRYGKDVKMDNMPPPPPAKNPSFLEYIIEMEQKGASFFMDGKRITANEAKTIAKNNKGKGTEMITQKDENEKYVVKLSKQIKD